MYHIVADKLYYSLGASVSNGNLPDKISSGPYHQLSQIWERIQWLLSLYLVGAACAQWKKI